MKLIAKSKIFSKNIDENSNKFKENFSSRISDKIGEWFYKLGFHVASNPWRTIFICIFFVILFGLGNFKLYFIKDPIELWVPTNSKFRSDTKWLLSKFDEGLREEMLIISAANILEPKNLIKLSVINDAISKVTVKMENGNMIGFEDVCFEIPMAGDLSGTVLKFASQNFNFKDQTTTEDPDPDFNFDEFNENETEGYDDTTIYPYNETEIALDEINEHEIIKREALDQSENNTQLIKPTKRPFNPSVDINSTVFCGVFETLPMGCRQSNILEIWKYKRNQIENLTISDIIEALNKTKLSPMTGQNVNYLPLLSGIKRNYEGKIISASSLLSYWYLKFNFSEVNFDEIGNTGGVQFWGSEDSIKWEGEFLKVIEELRPKLEDNDFKMFYQAQRSFSDSIGDDILNTFNVFKVSAILMFLFMELVLSKFSWIELRFILGIAGMVCVGFGTIITVGICSIFGAGFGPVQISFPLLLLGLGVDDMFVMMACYNTINKYEKDKPIPEKIGLMLQKSGIAITITSLTDFVAFLVGTTTSLNGIRLYCIYSSLGIIVVYLLVITLYVAVFALDEKRIEQRRNAFLPFIKHNEIKSKRWLDQNLMERFLQFIYSKVIFTVPGKTIVIILTIGCTGFSINNLLGLTKSTDVSWMIPKSSYLNNYTEFSRENFPNAGETAGVFMGNINITKSLPDLKKLSDEMKNRTDILSNFDSWVDKLDEFVQLYYKQDIYSNNITDQEIRHYISKFLFTADNGIYQGNLQFDKKLKCGESVSKVKLAFLSFNFKQFTDDRNIYAMQELNRILEKSNITQDNPDSYSTVWSNVFVIWSFIEVVDIEFFRNVILSLACVMICTVVLILDFQMCFWIFISVVLTLINVGGFMPMFGLKIDIISCLAFLLVVGLCVDYASHIGHTFLSISDGTRNDRALKTVFHIGAAIIYGAESTLIAMSMLVNSGVATSLALLNYVILVIIFGLFHGIVLLPVILSLIGPQPYHKSKSIDTKL